MYLKINIFEYSDISEDKNKITSSAGSAQIEFFTDILLQWAR